MPNAKDMQATVLAIVTFFVRPSIFLLVGLIAGYTLGFTDAFRDSDTIGNKAARVIYKVHPNAVSEGIYQRASVIRDTIHKRSGLLDAIEPPPN